MLGNSTRRRLLWLAGVHWSATWWPVANCRGPRVPTVFLRAQGSLPAPALGLEKIQAPWPWGQLVVAPLVVRLTGSKFAPVWHLHECYYVVTIWHLICYLHLQVSIISCYESIFIDSTCPNLLTILCPTSIFQTTPTDFKMNNIHIKSTFWF